MTLLGQIYLSYGQLKRAAQTFSTAIGHDPSDVGAIYGYAQVTLITLGVAVRVVLVTENGCLVFNLQTLDGLNRRDDTVTQYKRVLELEPNHAQAHAG